MAKGFMQKLGLDFFSTFSPMATLTTVRVLLAIAVYLSLDIIHADIPQAFCQSIQDTDIWMYLPPGIGIRNRLTGFVSKIVKLIRSLYGLRGSPQLWNKMLTKFFKEEAAFEQADCDACMFYRISPSGFVLVAVEVDDLVITGSDKAGIATLQEQLKVSLTSPTGDRSLHSSASTCTTTRPRVYLRWT